MHSASEPSSLPLPLIRNEQRTEERLGRAPLKSSGSVYGSSSSLRSGTSLGGPGQPTRLSDLPSPFRQRRINDVPDGHFIDAELPCDRPLGHSGFVQRTYFDALYLGQLRAGVCCSGLWSGNCDGATLVHCVVPVVFDRPGKKVFRITALTVIAGVAHDRALCKWAVR